MQVEHMRDAVGHDAHRAAGHAVAVQRCGIFVAAGPEIGGGGADEHPGLAARKAVGGPAGILNRRPRHFQQDALLRVHLLRFARREVEGRRVELADIADGAGGEGVGGARLGGAGGGFRVQVARLGKPVVRHFGDGVDPLV